MAFNASPVLSSDAFDNIRRQAVATKDYMQKKRDIFLQPTSTSDHVIAVIQHCAVVLPSLATWAATPGLAVYAQEQVNNPAYDIAAEYVSMRDAMASLRANLIALFPKDANGFLLYLTFKADGSGNMDARTFTAAQLSTVVTLVDAVIASIN